MLQDKVADWHFSDIGKEIDKLGDAANEYDRDGLKEVAQLGGVGVMKNFVRSKGMHNPTDGLGTSLRDYYDKLSSARRAFKNTLHVILSAQRKQLRN